MERSRTRTALTRRARARRGRRLYFFPAPSSDVEAYTNKPELLRAAAKLKVDPAIIAAGEELRTPAKGDCKMIYCTSVGDGPRVLPISESLIDPESGMPVASKVQKWQQTLGGQAGASGGCPIHKLPLKSLGAVALAVVGIAALSAGAKR